MTLRKGKIALVVFILAAGILGGFFIFAQTDQFTYDGQNHLTGITFEDNSSMQYTCDANGNIVTKTYSHP